MDKRQFTNYVSCAALICYIIGSIAKLKPLIWMGLGIITLLSIWNIIHWKENNKFTNYISVAICLAFLVYLVSSLRLLS